MNCPKCNSFNTFVVQTIRDNVEVVKRRRKCKECDTCWKTVELIDGNKYNDGDFAFKMGYSKAIKDMQSYIQSKGDEFSGQIKISHLG